MRNMRIYIYMRTYTYIYLRVYLLFVHHTSPSYPFELGPHQRRQSPRQVLCGQKESHDQCWVDFVLSLPMVIPRDCDPKDCERYRTKKWTINHDWGLFSVLIGTRWGVKAYCRWKLGVFMFAIQKLHIHGTHHVHLHMLDHTHYTYIQLYIQIHKCLCN